MRGHAMAHQTETAVGVTMLRSPGAAPPTASPQQDSTVNSGPAATSLNAASAVPNSNITSADNETEGKLRLMSRLGPYGKLSVCLLAGVALFGFGVSKAGLTIPFLSPTKAPALSSPIPHNNNASGITPPEFTQPDARQKEQTNTQPLSQLVPPHIEAAPPMPPAPSKVSLNGQEEKATVSPPPPLTSPKTPTQQDDVRGMEDQHFNNQMENATNREQAVPQKPDMGSDKLFIEMHHQLDTMSNQMKELESKLETAQQALNERVSVGLGKIDGRLDELQHREDLIESQKKTELAPQPQAAQPKVLTPAAPKTTDQSSVPVKEEHHAPKKASKEPAPTPLPHYTVQAGAPDIAILTDSAGTPIRVQPGSSLDGWGNVLSVEQSGNTWLVKTEHGTIR